jgi:hypothetical protein
MALFFAKISISLSFASVYGSSSDNGKGNGNIMGKGRFSATRKDVDMKCAVQHDDMNRTTYMTSHSEFLQTCA